MGRQRTVGVFYATGKLIGSSVHLLRIESLLRLRHPVVWRLLMMRRSLGPHHTWLLRCKALSRLLWNMAVHGLLRNNALLEPLIPITGLNLLRHITLLRDKSSPLLGHGPIGLHIFIIAKSLININLDTAQGFSIGHLLYRFQSASNSSTSFLVEWVQVQANSGVAARVNLRLIKNIVAVKVYDMRFPRR